MDENNDETVTIKGMLSATIFRILIGFACIITSYLVKDITILGTGIRWLLYLLLSAYFIYEAFWLFLSFITTIFNVDDRKPLITNISLKFIEATIIFNSIFVIGVTYSISNGLNFSNFLEFNLPWLSWGLTAYLLFLMVTIIPYIKHSMSGIVSEEKRELDFEKFKLIVNAELSLDISELNNPYEVFAFIKEKYKSNFLTFDCECIEDEDIYEHFVEQYCSITNQALVAKYIESKIDWDSEKAHIKGNISGKKINWSFKQDSDWFSDNFHNKMKLLSKKHTDGEFLMFEAEDQCAEVIFLKQKEAGIFKKYGYLA